MKELFSGKYQIIWVLSFSSINVDLGKDIAHNNVFYPCLKNENVLWIMEGIWTTANKFMKSIWLPLSWTFFAKLHAYGFSFAALRLIHSYLTNTKQRTKVNLGYSSWEEILFGIPQGSILGSIYIIQCISLWLVIRNEWHWFY